MISPSKEYLMIDDYVDENITIKIVESKPIIDFANLVEYYDDNDYSNLDYITIIDNKKNNIVGYFIGTDIENPTVKAFAGVGDLLYVIKEFVCEDSYKNQLFKYLERLARARDCSYIMLEDNKLNSDTFYSYIKDELDAELVDGYYILYVTPYIKGIKEDDKEIRKCYIGEIYEIGKNATSLYMDENYLGYVESDNLQYLYAFDYIVGYDNKEHDYFAYSIGYSIRETNDNNDTYNAYYIKDFFVYTQDEIKVDYAKKILNYVIDTAKFRSCKYLKIKLIDNKLYNLFYKFCKEHLGMIENNGYLIKRL